MKCDEAQQLYDSYLDSELEPKVTLEIQEHVATCPDCARLFAAEAKLNAQIAAGLKRGERTTALWEQIEQRVVAFSPPDTRPQPATLDSQPFSLFSAIKSQLSTLLWPHPKAWAGLASVWLVALTVNFATRETAPTLEAQRITPPSAETLRLLKAQEQLVTELIEEFHPRGTDRPKAMSPRPRTERRNERVNA